MPKPDLSARTATLLAALVMLLLPGSGPVAHAQQPRAEAPPARVAARAPQRRTSIDEVGSAKVVRGSVRIERHGTSDVLAAGATILRNDRLATGPGARVQLVFLDGSHLALGENAEIVIDDYVYRAGAKNGSLVLDMVRGAFRFTTGKLGLLEDKRIEVRMPAATLAVRGTKFWGGPIDGGTGILVFSGVVHVRSLGGAVLLTRRREGTMILAPGGAPSRPVIWPREKIDRAAAMVASKP
jgi:hypothetical protein